MLYEFWMFSEKLAKRPRKRDFEVDLDREAEMIDGRRTDLSYLRQRIDGGGACGTHCCAATSSWVNCRTQEEYKENKRKCEYRKKMHKSKKCKNKKKYKTK